MVKLYDKLRYLFPNANPSQFGLRDDGEGAYIDPAEWGLTESIPSAAELATIDGAVVTAWVAERERVAAIDQQLAQSDAYMPRLAEDMWGVLVTKGLVSDSDLPTDEARAKLNNRRALRASRGG